MQEETECGARTEWRSRLCLKFQGADVGERDAGRRGQEHLAVAIDLFPAFDSLHTIGNGNAVHRGSELTEIPDKEDPCFLIAPNAAVFAGHIRRAFELQVHPDSFSAPANDNLFAGHHEGLVHSRIPIAHPCQNRPCGNLKTSALIISTNCHLIPGMMPGDEGRHSAGSKVLRTSAAQLGVDLDLAGPEPFLLVSMELDHPLLLKNLVFGTGFAG